MKISRPFNLFMWLMSSLFCLSLILCSAILKAEEATNVLDLFPVAETTLKEKTQNTIVRAETLDETVEVKSGVGKPSAEAPSLRLAARTGGGRAMASKAVGNAESENTGITSQLKQTKTLYEAADDVKTDKEVRIYFDQAQELKEEAARLDKDVGTPLADTVSASVAAPADSPVVSGGYYKAKDSDEETAHDMSILGEMAEEKMIDVINELEDDAGSSLGVSSVLSNVEFKNR
ncbi:MAG TPA: hypothetical protein DD723_10020 [Candidatus Omnitrophica bacterium]|uniref:DUF5667 domain-containing protein n=1 Tax=candidate division CPR1 bacterium GW2011_GWA2_42_17 TaxID=1618341 RepID=A0A0G1C2R4_9BACT|nr:MAG: hypothetical protein UV05_C0016G0001 [candidate division CPR1 bacterium GW2011_GWA2_42_17]HBR15854.1 hypothetical protein [Candidatus Omnitrophota bacterium]